MARRKIGATAPNPVHIAQPALTGRPKPGPAATPSKQAQMIALLRRRQGATLAELMEVTGWQAHSVRGALSGTLQKKLGLTLTSATGEGRGRVYRLGLGA